MRVAVSTRAETRVHCEKYPTPVASDLAVIHFLKQESICLLGENSVSISAPTYMH